MERAVAAEESEAFTRESEVFDSSKTRMRTTTSVASTESMLGPSGFLNTAASVLNNLGLVYNASGEPSTARRLFLRAISLTAIALGEFHPSNAVRHRNLGAALRAMGYPELALKRFERAADMCALGYGSDHPETIRANEWVLFAKGEKDSEKRFSERSGVFFSSRLNASRRPSALPSVAEWFVEAFRCGVLEPPPEPPLPGERVAESQEERRNERSRRDGRLEKAPSPEGVGGTTPVPLPATATPTATAPAPATADAKPRASNDRTPPDADRAVASHDTTSEARDDRSAWSIATVAVAKGAARRARGLFAPLEPESEEDVFAPYAQPMMKVVVDETLPMWKRVSDERDALRNGTSAMASGRDFIAAYLEQAPGSANLITPFAEMPPELFMPYSGFRGYGAARDAAEPNSVSRLAHKPRAMESSCPWRRLRRDSGEGGEPRNCL
jgi:hypothetical protein